MWMEIKFLEIYGYGKWIDDGFELNPDLHIFYGKNEAGKTTLMSYIHSILFGFPSRNSQKSRYEPKESSRYGGKIYFTDNRLGDGVIERTAGKSSGDVKVTLENGTVGEDELSKELVHSIDRNLYQQLFSFHLEDLESIGQLNSDDINRYFVSVGVLGSKEYMSLADQLDQQASKLFKPSGKVPEINKQLKVLNKQNKKLARAREKNDEYLSLVKEVESINDLLNEINTQQNQNSQKLDQLKEIEKDWEVKVEMDELEKEIKNYSLPSLPEDGIYQLKQINSDIEKAHKKQRENQNKLQEYQKEHQPSGMFIAYEKNKSVIQTVHEKMPYLFEQQKELNELIVEKRYLDQNLSKEIAKENIDEQNDLPIIWGNDEDKKLEKWMSEIYNIDKVITENEKEYDYLSYQINSERREVDELEKKLNLSNEPTEETELTEERSNNKSIQSMTAVGIALGIVGTIVLSSGLRWLFLSITAVLAVIFFYQLKQSKKQEMVSEKPTPVHDAEIKNMWRNKLAQMDAHIEKQNQFATHTESLKETKGLIKTHWAQFKSDYLLPSYVQIQEAENKKEKYKEVHQLDSESIRLASKIAVLEDKIEKEIESVSFIYEFFPVQKDIDSKLQSINHFLNKVKDEEQYLEEYIRESGYIQKELDRLHREEEQYFNNKVALLQSVDVKSEEAFRELFDQLNEKERKTSRLNYLKERHLSLRDLKDFNSRKEVQNKINEYEQLEQESIQKERKLIESKAEINYDLEKLEAGYEFTTLLQDFENEKNTLHDLVQIWATRKVASMLIKNTLNYGTEGQLPQVLEDAEKYFSLLTNGRYKQIILTKDGIKVSDHSSREFYASELSRGTAEPLYVALRFAFIKNISQTLPLPIIVDDGFVNFDESRKKAVYTLLKEMSQYVQVLYFTFDEQVTEYVEESQITVLK